MQRALDLVQQMHTETLPQCLASISAVVAQTGLKRPTTLATLKEFAELLATVSFWMKENTRRLTSQARLAPFSAVSTRQGKCRESPVSWLRA